MQKVAAVGHGVKFGSILARVASQGRNYSSLVAWLMYSVFKGRMRKLAVAITLNLVSLSTQAAAIYIVYWYARQMEASGAATIPYLDLQFKLQDRPELLWVVVALSALCFAVSAFLIYRSRQLVLDIAEEHYGLNLNQLVWDARCLPDARARLASRLCHEWGVGGLSTGCRRAALIAASFATAIAAVIGGIGASVFLIRIDWSLTLLIFVAAGFAAFLLYPLTLRGVQSARRREKARASFKNETRRLYESHITEQPLQPLPSAIELAHAYLLRRRVMTELVLAIEIGVTVIVSVVIFYMAQQAFSGRENWAIFIAYIGALRIALSGVSAAVQVFASVSRFYPNVVRYYLFVRDFDKINRERVADVKAGDTVILGALTNGTDVVSKAGERIALVTVDPLQKVLYTFINASAPPSHLPVSMGYADAGGVLGKEGTISLVYLGRSGSSETQFEKIADLMKDKVALIAYISAENVGACGEEYLLTVADSEMLRYARLGTEEAEAALREIAAMKRKRASYEDEDDEDE